jgi:hypothetical protein
MTKRTVTIVVVAAVAGLVLLIVLCGLVPLTVTDR